MFYAFIGASPNASAEPALGAAARGRHGQAGARAPRPHARAAHAAQRVQVGGLVTNYK